MRNLKQVVLDFIFNERPAYLSAVSLNYWLRIERKRNADKGVTNFPKRVKKNDQPITVN